MALPFEGVNRFQHFQKHLPSYVLGLGRTAALKRHVPVNLVVVPFIQSRKSRLMALLSFFDQLSDDFAVVWVGLHYCHPLRGALRVWLISVVSQVRIIQRAEATKS
jgi:hypothetical protein